MSTTTKEYLWVIYFSIFLLFLSSLPMISGSLAQSENQRFIGSYFDKQDYAVHLAMIHYGEQGHWDYQFRFTTEFHSSYYLRIFYVFLGNLNRFLHLPANILFQLSRLFFGLIAIFSVYRLFTRVFISINQRRLATILATLGSGAGWIQTIVDLPINSNLTPIDFWLIDAYFLFSLSLFPHFMFTVACICLAITAYIDFTRNQEWYNLLIICCCAFIVQIVNPIAFILADFAMVGVCVFSCWQSRKHLWDQLFALIIITLIQIPLLIYSAKILLFDPSWAIYSQQNATLSPQPAHYFLGFTLFWPFVAVGIIKSIETRNTNLGWAIFWCVSAFLLAYSPFPIQRRFLLGITIPLSALAAPTIMDASDWISQKFNRKELSGAILITGLSCISSLVLLISHSIAMFDRPKILFEPVALVNAVDWLSQQGTYEETVLASEATAQLIAMRSPFKLYYGHEMETLNYSQKEKQIEKFYKGDQSKSWLRENDITWIFLGPNEKDLVIKPLEIYTNINKVYEKDGVLIYFCCKP